MQGKPTKDDWVAMFREIGLDDATMVKWHMLFEARHPQEHGNFLGWLGLSEDEIADIRAKSR